MRAKVPPEVFTKPYTNPVNGTPENLRNNLREALRLLKEAGYELRNQKLVNAKSGEPFVVEFLVSDPNSERFVLFYKPSLDRLGMTVSVRTVDDAQYVVRQRSWDYDIITAVWGKSLSPGNEQRGYWGSQAADQAGSRNLIGIKNEAVDALIDRVIFAKDRAELVAATKALDRVCCGTTTSCRNGPTASSARRAGTASGGPRPCRNTPPRRFRPSGGGTRSAPPRRVRASGSHPPRRSCHRSRRARRRLSLPQRMRRTRKRRTASRRSAT